MLGVMLAATVAVALISYPVAAWMGVRPGAKGTFAQAVLRGNLAFVGLPIIYELPDVTLAGGLSLRAAAVLTVAPMMVLFNITSVMALLASRHQVGWAMAGPLLKQLASTPPLVASLAGLGWAWAGWALPTMLDQALGSLGEMALPLGLLGVGGSLVTVNLGGKWATPLAAALLKTLAAPALGWLVGRWVGLGPVELKTVMIFLAAPTAVVSFTVASELKGD
jgi:predicted permease